MSIVRVELDNLSSEEMECDNGIKSNFIVANTSEADVDYCEPENMSLSPTLPGMFKSKSGTDKEHQLKPSRRSMPCLAQSQTHPQHLNNQSSVQNRVQPQPVSEGSSAIDVEQQRDSTKDTYTDESEHGTYDCRTDQSLLIQHKLNRQKQGSHKSQKCKEDLLSKEKHISDHFPPHTEPFCDLHSSLPIITSL
ncbi:PREDICTED: anoctamin-3-like [Nanorana parkeri]|uniref:anoctamin-3-like n=1 Tax=Nanorana parkeri TaxID=125878 RepID=UPI0008548318|nr:PREDICTED: anoctamin-3-like [Nanorana parkeri]